MWWREFLFTGAYTGYFPVASGTAGTLLAMSLYILEYLIFGESSWIANLLVVAVMFFPAIKLGDEGERFFGVKDPSEVVLDEIIGYDVAVLFHPFSWGIALGAFIIFRVLDILKPFPARRLESLGGGLGVLCDDLVAGIYANLILVAILYVSSVADMPIY